MAQVNRSLRNEAMDNIDHALGRPFDPVAETYRNYFATDGAQADQMASSHFWEERRSPPGSKLRGFTVTTEGRKALAVHLREIGDPHRAFTVRFDDNERTVISTSRSKARYSYFGDVSDVMPDLTFQDFCRRSSVRVEA